MSEDATADVEEEPATVEDEVWARDTAPQTPYTMRQVAIGIIVLVNGAVISFGVPLALT